MTISDEAVEAAAKAIYATEAQPIYDEAKEEFTGARPWEWLTERSWDAYREKAKLALEAAAPYIRAEALEGASDFIDLPGSSASGYYASEQDSGYREAERHAEAWLRARAAEMRQG